MPNGTKLDKNKKKFNNLNERLFYSSKLKIGPNGRKSNFAASPYNTVDCTILFAKRWAKCGEMGIWVCISFKNCMKVKNYTEELTFYNSHVAIAFMLAEPLSNFQFRLYFFITLQNYFSLLKWIIFYLDWKMSQKTQLSVFQLSPC